MIRKLSLVILTTILSPIVSHSEALNLFKNGHPATAKQGSVLSATVLENCLISSFRAIDGEQRLDTFSYKNNTATFSDTIAYGNLLEDQNNLIPNANLKAARDLAIVNKNVIWWSYFKVYASKLDSECKFKDVKSYDFNNSLNTVFNRTDTSAEVLSKRTVLTDQEVINLITSGVPNDVINDMQFKSGLFNFSQHDAPFLAGFAPQLGIVGSNNIERFNLNINGKSSVVSMLNKNSIDISVYSPAARSEHIDSFYSKRIKTLFNSSNAAKTLGELKTLAISGQFLADGLNEVLIENIFEQFDFDLSGDLHDALSKLGAGNVKVLKILKKYNLNANSTIKQAVNAIVLDFSKKLEIPSLNSALSVGISGKIGDLFFADTKALLKNIKDTLSADMAAELASKGLVDYFVDTLMNPLVGNIPALEFKLSTLLDGIISSNIGTAVDAALSSFSQALPVQAFIDLFLDIPACLQIPNSARDFIDLTLIKSGPKLNPDGVAFFELLKLYEYYYGNNDFNKIISDLKQRIEKLQLDIAEELAIELGKSINFSGDLNSSIAETLSTNFNPEINIDLPNISVKISEKILDNLKSRNININAKLSIFLLKAAKKSTSRRSTNISNRKKNKKPKMSNDDKKLIEALNFEKFLKSIKPKQSQDNLLSVLNGTFDIETFDTTSIVEEIDLVISNAFGKISLGSKLSEAANFFIRSNINPNLVANFVSETIGSALSTMSANSANIPISLKKIQRAVNGDCLAIWQTNLDAATAAATLANLGAVATAFSQAEAFLGTALDKGIEFVVNQTLSAFFQSIITTAAGSYPRWNLGLQQSDHSFTAANLSGVTTKLASIYSFRDKLLLIQRNNGGSIPDPNESAEVLVTLFSLDGAKAVTSLGNWNTIAITGGQDGLIFLSGNNSTTPQLLLDYRDGSLKKHVLAESVPIDFLNSDKINLLKGNKIMLHSELSGIYIADLQ